MIINGPVPLTTLNMYKGSCVSNILFWRVVVHSNNIKSLSALG